MTEYEILLLLDPDTSEDRQNEIVTRIRETVERGEGGWDRHVVWGRRKLAYEIDHKPEGVYHLLLFTSPTETLAEVSRVLKITDGVVRHLAVRRVKGGSTKAPAPMAASAPAPTRESAPPRAAAPAPSEDLSAPADDTVEASE